MAASASTERDFAIDALVELLGESDNAVANGDFYDRLCAAACRLTRLRRAVLMLYADAYRAVRTVGSFGLEPAVASLLEGTLEETPIAQRALAEDDVIVTSELEGQVPDRYRQVIATEMVACVPVAAGGRWLGVIFADCGGGPFELDESDRLPLRTLGRAAALVASVAEASDRREKCASSTSGSS